ncbi:hypothetical protein DFS33DRAFT_1454464 [Desarmillaria ectypa]|nr:hypothetical protein DFS33DRAFT_1454464 [Desarmillaria ectypa]
MLFFFLFVPGPGRSVMEKKNISAPNSINIMLVDALETATKFAPTQSSSVLGGQIVGRSERQAAPPAALKLRLDLNLEVEIAIQAKVNGDITLSLLAAFQYIFDRPSLCVIEQNSALLT